MATICGVTYRHSNYNLGGFLQYLNSTTEHIDQGSKYCNICADLDLLKIEKHQPANDFFKYNEVFLLPTSDFTTN